MRRVFTMLACPLLLAIAGVFGPSVARADTTLPASLFLVRQGLVSVTGASSTSSGVGRPSSVVTLVRRGTSMVRVRGLRFDRATLILQLSGTRCHGVVTTAMMDSQRQRLHLPLGRWQRRTMSARPPTVAHTLGVSFIGPARDCRLQLAGAQLHVVPETKAAEAPKTKPTHAYHPIALGAAVRWSNVSSVSGYANLFLSNFQWMTAEDEMKMAFLAPARNSYDFSTADRMVAWALANGKQVHGHTLIWDQELPGWLAQGQPGLLGLSHQPWTAPQLQQIMDGYITTVMSHFKGKVPEWDVVNEGLRPDGSFDQDIWYQTIGSGYIEEAYRAARAADPSAKLCYNEIGAEVAGAEADALYTLISTLRSEGLVDCLGFEMHVSASGIAEADLESNWRRFAALGVEIHVSEMDDDISQLQGDEPTRQAIQAQAYRAAADACYRIVQCTQFTTWGMTDASTWIPGANAEPLMFDANMAPKPAWYALQQSLHTHT
jgi:endo-1,4-beta-xylanase